MDPRNEQRKSSMVECPYQTTFRPRSFAWTAASTASGSTVLICTAAASADQWSEVPTPARRRHSRC